MLTLKFPKLNRMMKYIVMAVFLAFAMTLMQVGVNVFIAILGGFVLIVLGFMLCLLIMRLETDQMKRLNNRMNETKELDGYIEGMQKIAKRTVWQSIYDQCLLNQGTGYINLGEYRKALEVMDGLETHAVTTTMRFLEVWNRLFALTELRSYGKVERLMKQYQKILDSYAAESENIADRLEIFRCMAAGDNEVALEKIRSCREKCLAGDESERVAVDQLDYYEMRLCDQTGDKERAEELRASLRSRKVFPCIARAL